MPSPLAATAWVIVRYRGVPRPGVTDAAEMVRVWSEGGAGKVVCAANVHMVMTAWDDPSFAEELNGSDLTVCDGRPLYLICRLAGDRRRGGRDRRRLRDRRRTDDPVVDVAGRAVARPRRCAEHDELIGPQRSLHLARVREQATESL